MNDDEAVPEGQDPWNLRRVGNPIRQKLADEDLPLNLALAGLAIAKRELARDFLTPSDISGVLAELGVPLSPTKITKSLARAGSKVIRRRRNRLVEYVISTLGQRAVDHIVGQGTLGLIYIDGSHPRSARGQLEDILSKVAGIARILDPWFGVRTLDALEMIPDSCEVRFLCCRTSENGDRFRRSYMDFKSERPLVEMRRFPGDQELHDRYILDESTLMIVGHGLKDFGRKESFVIVLDKATMPDIHATMSNHFDERWARAIPL